MRIAAISLALFALIASSATAQEATYGLHKKSDLNNMLDSLSNMLSATNPKTAADQAEPASGDPSPDPKLSRINSLPPLVQPQPPQVAAQPVVIKPQPQFIQPQPKVAALPVAKLPLPEKPVDNEYIKLSPQTRNLIRSAPSNIDSKPKGVRGMITMERGNFDPDKEAEIVNRLQEVEKEEPKAKIDIEMENSRNSDSYISLIEQGQKAMGAGQYETATTLFKSALKREPKNRDALFGLATVYHKSGQRQQAREAYAKLLKAYPNYKDGINNMLVFVAEESPKDAINELNQFEARNPNFAATYVQKAALYSKLGDNAAARKNLLKAVSLEPDNVVYKYNLAVLLDNMGETANAAKLYGQLLDAGSKGEVLPVERTQILERMNYLGGVQNPS